MKEFISKVVDGIDLERDEAEEAIKTIMSGKSNDIKIAAFLTALRIKGETPEEIASFARIMRDFALRIEPEVDGVLVDVCGTGGDGMNTFNISTTSMFVIAAAGVPVAKHGNRALTSNCGSADVLEELGAKIDLPPEKIKESIEEIGMGFMFAPLHHSAMKHVMPVRKALGFRTVFNILGPLTNPANAKAQLMGVFHPGLTEKIAEVFGILGLERAMVVHGEPGLDEISILGKTKISELNNGVIDTYYITPEDYGLSTGKLEDIGGGTAEDNANILTAILKGEEEGPKRDIIILNAAAGILIGDAASDLAEGVEISKEILESGKAYTKLQEFIKFTR